MDAAAERTAGGHHLELSFQRRKLERDDHGYPFWKVCRERVALAAGETALLLCDVWDSHTCRGAFERLEAMVPRMNEVVKSARGKGVLIVHAPSDTMGFYEGSPARRLRSAGATLRLLSWRDSPLSGGAVSVEPRRGRARPRR